MNDQKLLEGRIRETLHDRAAGVAATPALYDRIERGIRRHRWWSGQFVPLAAAAAAVIGVLLVIDVSGGGAEPEILDQPPGASQPAPSASNGDTGRSEELEAELRMLEDLARLRTLQAQVAEIEARIAQLEKAQEVQAERHAEAVAEGADNRTLEEIAAIEAELDGERRALEELLRTLQGELDALGVEQPEGLQEPPIVERGCGWPAEAGIRAAADTSALHSAVLEGDIPEVEAQLQAGVDPNVIDERLAATPLQDAVSSNCVELVELLLDAGADPALVAPGGGSPTALSQAVNVGDPQIVDLLLAAGADPSQWDGGAKALPPLHEAVGTGRISLLPRLVDRASDIDVAATGGDPLASGEDVGLGSALEFAAEGRVQAAAMLIEAGATPTRTAIYRAVYAGNIDIVVMLIDAGAPMTAAPSGRTLKEVAVEQGHDDLAETLDRLTTQS